MAGTLAAVSIVIVRADQGRTRADLEFSVVGRTGFEPVTSSVSVPGSCLAGSHDLAMSGGGGELR
jgi:hypothetical protein